MSFPRESSDPITPWSNHFTPGINALGAKLKTYQISLPLTSRAMRVTQASERASGQLNQSLEGEA